MVLCISMYKFLDGCMFSFFLSTTAGSYDDSMFNILSNCQTFSHSWCTYEGSDLSTSLTTLVTVIFWIMALLVGVKRPWVLNNSLPRLGLHTLSVKAQTRHVFEAGR